MKKSLIPIIIMFLLIPSNMFVSDATAETWENQYGKLEIYPDVSTGIITQIQYCNLTSYIDDAEIDITFRFDIQVNNPDIWIWRNISHTVSVPDYGWIESEYTLYNISDFNLIDEPKSVVFGDIPSNYYANGNCSIFWGDGVYEPLGYIDVGFDSFEWQNPQHTICKFTYTYFGITGYHNEQQYWFDWDNIKSLFSYVQHNDKHYYYARSWMIKEQLYQFKWSYDIPLGSDGKWDLLAKLSSDPLGTWRVSIDPWWNSNWNYYVPITIESDYIDADLTNFPVLVNSTNTTMIAKCNGGDSVRFVSTDNTTEFAYEIEEWTANGFTIWVNISEIITSDTDYQFLMYYNNSGVSDNQNPTGVWDNNFVMVQHMNDITNSSTTDSTIYGNDGTKKSANDPLEVDGVVGFAQDFYFNDYINCKNNTCTNITTPMSLSAFIYLQYLGDSFFVAKVNPTNSRGYALRMDIPSNKAFFMYRGTNGAQVDVVSNVWYHLTGVWNGTHILLYCNGSEVGTPVAKIATDYPLATALTIGMRQSGGFPSNAIIDEVRLSNIERNSSWINASFHSQNQSSHLGNFLTFGSEESIPVFFFYSVIPSHNSTDICPCSDAMCFGFNNSLDYNMNISVYRNDSLNETFYLINKYLNISTGVYCFTIDGHMGDIYYPIKYNETYYWYVNATTVNTTDYYVSDILHFTTATDPDDCLPDPPPSVPLDTGLSMGIMGGIFGGIIGSFILFKKKRKK